MWMIFKRLSHQNAMCIHCFPHPRNKIAIVASHMEFMFTSFMAETNSVPSNENNPHAGLCIAAFPWLQTYTDITEDGLHLSRRSSFHVTFINGRSMFETMPAEV
jgi:hypothetical protein